MNDFAEQRHPHDELEISAVELQKLPLEQRSEILRRQAELAEPLYRTIPELTDIADCDDEVFDAYEEQAKAG